MRIVGFEAAWYSIPFERPITNARYTYAATDLVFCRLRTDEGAEGVGWVHGSRIVYEALRQLEPYVVGRDPFRYEAIWAGMYLPKVFGRKGLTTRAISCVDIALWDLMGRVTGQPVWKLLGGHADRVPAYVAGGYYVEGKGLDDLAAEMAGYVQAGARAVKMKVGGLPIKQDAERVRVVREAVGPDVRLLVDANNAYRAYEAIQFARAVEPYDVYWLEEPVAPDDLQGSARVRQAGIVPVAAGENEYTRWGFRDLALAGACDIWNADAQVLGGITEWRKVASLAQAFEIPIAPHGDQEIHVHLVASAPNGLIVEYYDRSTNPLREALFGETALRLQDGCVSPPDRPGLGVHVDFKAIERYRVA